MRHQCEVRGCNRTYNCGLDYKNCRQGGYPYKYGFCKRHENSNTARRRLNDPRRYRN
jgi:hypothetical protein